MRNFFLFSYCVVLRKNMEHVWHEQKQDSCDTVCLYCPADSTRRHSLQVTQHPGNITSVTYHSVFLRWTRNKFTDSYIKQPVSALPLQVFIYNYTIVSLNWLAGISFEPGPGLRLAQPGAPTDRVSVLPILPEDGRRSSFRNVILLKYGRWTKSKKTLLQSIKRTWRWPHDGRNMFKWDRSESVQKHFYYTYVFPLRGTDAAEAIVCEILPVRANVHQGKVFKLNSCSCTVGSWVTGSE
jgi:hypothetical protein